jgi:spermidine synthase
MRFETCLFDNGNAADRIQVFERGDRLELRFGNTIVQSAKSRTAPDVLQLDYTRALLACMLLVGDAPAILHIGLGAGTIPSFIYKYFPQARQRVVELNRDVIAVAEKFCDVPKSERLDVVQDEGLNHLRIGRDTFDLVIFDAFHANGAAPDLTTAAAFDLARRRLKPGGWIVNNAWGSDATLLRTMVVVLKERFKEVHQLSVRMHSNVILFAGTPAQRTTFAALQERATALSARMPLDFAPWLRQLSSTGQSRPTLVTG